MFYAEILWLRNGPVLIMRGRLVGDRVEQLRSLLSADLIPKGLIVDLTALDDIDSAGEHLLTCLSNFGVIFVANGLQTTGICKKLGLSIIQKRPAPRHNVSVQERPSTHSHTG